MEIRKKGSNTSFFSWNNDTIYEILTGVFIMNYLFNFDTIIGNFNDSKVQAALMALEDFNINPEPFFDKSNIIESFLKMESLNNMDDKTFCEFMDQYKSYYLNLRFFGTEMTSNAIDVLNLLKDQGSLLFLISSETTINLKQMLLRLGHFHLFDGVYGSDSKIHYKPHPQIIESILDSYHLSKHDLMMVGSDIHDIKMAQEAGILTCMVSQDASISLKADCYIESLSELLHDTKIHIEN